MWRDGTACGFGWHVAEMGRRPDGLGPTCQARAMRRGPGRGASCRREIPSSIWGPNSLKMRSWLSELMEVAEAEETSEGWSVELAKMPMRL